MYTYLYIHIYMYIHICMYRTSLHIPPCGHWAPHDSGLALRRRRSTRRPSAAGEEPRWSKALLESELGRGRGQDRQYCQCYDGIYYDIYYYILLYLCILCCMIKIVLDGIWIYDCFTMYCYIIITTHYYNIRLCFLLSY